MGGHPEYNNLVDYSGSGVKPTGAAAKIPASRVAYGVDGEMLEVPVEQAPAATNKEHGNFFGRDASKPASQTEESSKVIHKELDK